MQSTKRSVGDLCAMSAFLFLHSAAAAPLKINGSTTVNLPVAEAAEVLRAEKKMQIQVDTQGGSSGGISMLGEEQVDIGMSSKHLSDSDRASFPKVNFPKSTSAKTQWQ
jgi:phosphate transport system substrate-binding protein